MTSRAVNNHMASIAADLRGPLLRDGMRIVQTFDGWDLVLPDEKRVNIPLSAGSRLGTLEAVVETIKRFGPAPSALLSENA